MEMDDLREYLQAVRDKALRSKQGVVFGLRYCLEDC